MATCPMCSEDVEDVQTHVEEKKAGNDPTHQQESESNDTKEDELAS